MEKQQYGVMIERGVVTAVSNGGYRVRSFDRDGIESPPIRSIDETKTYETGETVWFFLHRDGTGKIVCGY